MSSQGLKRSLPPEDDSSHSSRPRKRPGGASRLTNHDKETARDVLLKRQQEREQEAKKAAAFRGVHDVVRQHYNAVPQRGRDWRKTESRIKGLRSFNNWVKSTIIHKFSPDGSAESGNMLRVLDLGCGKGGDLGKWQQSPQPVELLVGIDPAEVSIDQARERYMQMRGRGGRGGRGSPRIFDAEFYAQDAFGRTIRNIPIIHDVGFDAPNSRRGGGFDVVSMMFCMHYAFESEAKTRGMLQNVSGSLKKGGRFIGAIPSSDVIRAKVQAFYRAEETLQSQVEKAGLLPDLYGSKPHLDATSIEDTKLTPTLDSKSQSVSGAQSLVPDSKPTTTQDTQQDLLTDTQPASSEDTNPEVAKDTNLAPAQDVKSAFPQETILAPTQEAKPAPAQEAKPAPAQEAVLAPAQEAKPSPAEEAKPASPLEAKPAPAQDSNPVPPQESKQGHHQDSAIVPTQKTNAVPTSDIPSVAEWGNTIYRVRFSGPAPKDGMFRPPYGWKYSYFMEEAVEEIPEYVVPWEAFRA